MRQIHNRSGALFLLVKEYQLATSISKLALLLLQLAIL